MLFIEGYNTENTTLTYVYAHGELVDKIKFDICETNKLELIDAYNKVSSGELDEYITEELIFTGDEMIRCIVLLWRGSKYGRIRGFIFDPFDLQSLTHCYDSFYEKKDIL